MELEIEIISSEMIKPSTPTPPHLKHFKLSLLDQFFQFTFVPHILLYNPPYSTNEDVCTDQIDIISQLKTSLSQSLALYYPFAGRLAVDESAIECNDKGVFFKVARAHDCSIVNFLEAPNRVDLVGRFLSSNIYDNYYNTIGDTITNTSTCTTTSNNDDKNGGDTDTDHVSPPLDVTKLVPITIQVTIFDCGGYVIGSQWLHKVCDAASWGHFLKTWASYAAGRNEDVVFPDFETAFSVFPPRSPSVQPVGRKARTLVPLSDDEAAHVMDGLCLVKAFSFSPDAISAIQAKGSSSDVPNPTRIEAVSGFIWKHAMSAARASSSASSQLGLSALSHAVNMRPRFQEPLPSTTFGNALVDTIAQYDPTGHFLDGQTGPELQDLVYQIRKALFVAKDAKFLGKFIGPGGAEVLYKYKQELGGILGDSNITTYKFTSWIGLDICTDFGFGVPVWTGFTGGRLSSSYKNLIILMETLNCGIEAWLILDEQEMLILQGDLDFTEFALPSAATV